MKNLKNQIKAKIEEAQAKFDSIEMSLEESQANQEEATKVILAKEFDAEAFVAVGSREKADLHDQIQMLQKTMTQQLVQVKTPFVLTTQAQLTSPSGFHPDERVFVLETGHEILGVETLPRSSNMNAFNV